MTKDNNIRRYEHNEDRNGMYEVLPDQFNSWDLYVKEIDHLKDREQDKKTIEAQAREIYLLKVEVENINELKKDLDKLNKYHEKEIERLKKAFDEILNQFESAGGDSDWWFINIVEKKIEELTK